jgi:uncharacterized protein involved in outer membrane biogenesis
MLRRHHWLAIVGAIAGVFLLATVVALEALKSNAVKSRIATALSSALGQPVEIGALSVSVLPRPLLVARDIRIGAAGPAAAPGITLGGLIVVPSLFSLLPGRTRTINEIALDTLVLSVRRAGDGHWLLPVAPVPSASQSPTPQPATKSGDRALAINLDHLSVRHSAARVVDDSLRSASGAPTITTISDIAADVQAVGGSISASHFAGRLGQTVVNGSAHMGPSGAALELSSPSITNADLPSLFALTGMRPYGGLSIGGTCTFEMAATIGGDLAKSGVKGKIAFGDVRIGTIAMQNFNAPFQLEHGVFTLDPITFGLYKGQMHGVISVDLNHPAPTYAIRATLVGLDVDQALSANTTMKDVLLGTGRLATDVHGSGTTGAAIQESLAGTLNFDLENGDLRHMPLLARINSVLGLTEGSSNDTKFESLTGNATIGGGKATTNDLTLRAGKLTMLAQGAYGFDQSLQFKTLTTVSGAKAQNVGQMTGLAKPQQNGQGGLQIPGHIAGTASDPKIAIDVGSIAKQEGKNVVRGLTGLFSKH